MRCSGARPLGSAIACYNLGPCWTARTVDVGRSLLRSGLPLVAPASATDCNQCFRVAASSKSTAAGSSSSATTRINHRKTTSSAWPRRVARYRTGPRSASTVRRSPSTAAFSIFRSARAFASTRSLSARLLRFACRRSSSRGAKLGDRRRAQGDGRTERLWGRRGKVREPPCLPSARTSAPIVHEPIPTFRHWVII
jgi:hypothetical protein